MLLLLPIESQAFGHMPDTRRLHQFDSSGFVPFTFGPRCLDGPRFRGRQTNWNPCQRSRAKTEGGKTQCRAMKPIKQSPVWKTIVNCSGFSPDDMDVKVRRGEVLVRYHHEDREAGNVVDIKKTISVPHDVDPSSVTCRFYEDGLLLLKGSRLKNSTEEAKQQNENEMGRTETPVAKTHCSGGPSVKFQSENAREDNTTCHKVQVESNTQVQSAQDVEMENTNESTKMGETDEKTTGNSQMDAHTEETTEENDVQDKEDDDVECEEETSTDEQLVSSDEFVEECDKCYGESTTAASCGVLIDEGGKECCEEQSLQDVAEADDTQADEEVDCINVEETKGTEVKRHEGLMGGHCFTVSLGLQNYKPSEIRVTVQDNLVRVSAERVIRGDNFEGTEMFERRVCLPPSADPSTVFSKLQEDGQLIIEASCKTNTEEDIVIPVKNEDQ